MSNVIEFSFSVVAVLMMGLVVLRELSWSKQHHEVQKKLIVAEHRAACLRCIIDHEIQCDELNALYGERPGWRPKGAATMKERVAEVERLVERKQRELG